MVEDNIMRELSRQLTAPWTKEQGEAASLVKPQVWFYISGEGYPGKYIVARLDLPSLVAVINGPSQETLDQPGIPGTSSQ